jgi:hypothetical protein
MQEVELTAQRLLSVWWLIFWRGTIGGMILGFLVGGIIGFVMAIAGSASLAAAAGGYAGLTVMPFWGLLVVYMALRKNYKGFRIALAGR